MLADARRHGSEALTYQRVIGMEVAGRPDHRGDPARRADRHGLAGLDQVRGLRGRGLGGPDRGPRQRQRRDDARQGHDADLQPPDDRRGDQPLPPLVRRRHHGPRPHRRDPRHDRHQGPRSGRLRDHPGGGRAPRQRGREDVPGPAADAHPARLRGRAAALPAPGRRGPGRGQPLDLPGPRDPRPRRPGRGQLRVDRRRQADDAPAHGRADRGRRRGARWASRPAAPRPTRCSPTRRPATPTGWATASRITRRRAAATPTSCASASS